MMQKLFHNFLILFVATAFVVIIGTRSVVQAQGVDADPGQAESPPPPPQPQGEPRPDLMPQQPVEAVPENGAPSERDYRGYERPRPWPRSHPPYENYDEESRLRLYGSIFYNFAGTGYSNNSTYTNNSFSIAGPFSVDMNTAPGLKAEVFMAPPFGWGFSAGLDYDFSRNIQDINTPNNSYFYTGTVPTLQMTTLYGNAVFRWANIYLPFGLNFTLPSFSAGSGNGTIGSTSVTGGLGYQVAVGFLIGHHFAVELQDRVNHFQATSSTAARTITWGDVYLSGFQLNLKYGFL